MISRRALTGTTKGIWWELRGWRASAGGWDLRLGPAYQRSGPERTLTLSVPGFALSIWWKRA
ncbi:MAG TPA: hypothetical protein VGR26_14880 [Acidimicrobiales bacterium]|nr:hypothetical protein [Acidimicrobiales bacterium]